MPWVLNHTDEKNVYWRRTEDSYVIGFNRPGVGTPSSTESSPPVDIDKHATPLVVSVAAPITKLDFFARFSDAQIKNLITKTKANSDLEVKMFRLHGIVSLTGYEAIAQEVETAARTGAI